MATITSAQSGYASATSTWTGGVVPGNGDLANIKPSHSVIWDFSTTVGDGTTSIYIAGGGSTATNQTATLTIASGVTITHNGNLMWEAWDTRNVNATLIMDAGSNFVFTGAFRPIMDQGGGGLGTWTINGTDHGSGQVTITGETGYISVGLPSNGNYNSINWNYAYFSGFDPGSGTNYNAAAGRYVQNSFVVKNCRFKNSANWLFGGNNVSGTMVVDIQNNDWRSITYRGGDGANTSKVIIDGDPNVAASATRIFKNNTLDAGNIKLADRHITADGNIVSNGQYISYGSYIDTVNSLIFTSTGSSGSFSGYVSPGGSFTNTIFGASVDNWHGLGTAVSTANNSTFTWDGVYADSFNTGNANIFNPSGNFSIIAKNCIFNGLGTVITTGTGAGYTTTLQNSVVNLDNGVSSSYGFAFLAETAPPYDNWIIKNNIFVDVNSSQNTSAITPVLTAVTNGVMQFVDYNASFLNPAKPGNGKTYTEVYDIASVMAVRQETTIFTGTGLNNATVAGNYVSGTSTATYDIKISSTGATDQWQWRKDGGSWSAGINCTTTYTAFDTVTNVGVTGPRIKFAAVTGHTVDDLWSTTFTVLERGVDTGYLAHSIANIDPQFVDSTRSLAKFADYVFGETGNTATTAAAKFLTINGWDGTNNVTHNAGYTIPAALAWLREGFRPQNMTLATAGEAGTYIGAVEPSAPADDYHPAAFLMGY